MKREIKIGLLSLLLLGGIGVTYYLFSSNLISYAIITTTLTLIIAVIIINYIFNTKNEESIFNSNLKQILKTYDAILVKSNNIPEIKGKNIIQVASIDDLVDAQVEIRKPIYYKKQTESCSFVLLDSNEALVYILKVNDQVLSPLDIMIKELEIEKNKKDKDESILEGIDKTTIVKLENKKSYKVSPIRKQQDKEQEFIEVL